MTNEQVLKEYAVFVDGQKTDAREGDRVQVTAENEKQNGRIGTIKRVSLDRELVDVQFSPNEVFTYFAFEIIKV